MNATPLSPHPGESLRRTDERLVSYNIEMTEITGGTFWKEYTPAQIAGKEPFRVSGTLTDFTAMEELMQYYPPINLYHPLLRSRAKALGPAWVRVSGSWATKTYYDLDGKAKSIPPRGYASVLTKAQWTGVLDFVKAVGAKLLISVSNCAGDHPDGGPLSLKQTEAIFRFSRAYGVEIDAAEFMNEPNMLEFSGAPKGYTAADYARDQDIFNRWVKSYAPSCLLVGPSALGDGGFGKTDAASLSAGIGAGMKVCSTHELLENTEIPLDVFSYHCYNGVSERLASLMPQAHWGADRALSDAYLAVTEQTLETYLSLRDRYAPGAPVWITESGDAGGGGTTWASTFLDVFRTLNELGVFSDRTEGIVFHNTLASSDYGFLRRETFVPRPNYYAVLLWNRLMGREVFAAPEGPEECRIFCRSRKDGTVGAAYLILNLSKDSAAVFSLPKQGEVYRLTAPELRASRIQLNGKELIPQARGSLPELLPLPVPAGNLILPPRSCTFLLL